jgi:hypothetical protein
MPRTPEQEKAFARVDQLLMQMLCAAGAELLKAGLDAEDMGDKIGFALVMFDFGDPGGSMAYASTAQRDDFLRLLDELRGKLAASLPDAKKGD